VRIPPSERATIFLVMSTADYLHVGIHLLFKTNQRIVPGYSQRNLEGYLVLPVILPAVVTPAVVTPAIVALPVIFLRLVILLSVLLPLSGVSLLSLLSFPFPLALVFPFALVALGDVGLGSVLLILRRVRDFLLLHGRFTVVDVTYEVLQSSG